MRKDVMTIVAQNGGCVPYTRETFSLWVGEQFEECDNGKEERIDNVTGMVFKGNTEHGVLWSNADGSGRFIGKYKRPAHMRGVIKMINDAFDEGEEYFVMPSMTEYQRLIKNGKTTKK